MLRIYSQNLWGGLVFGPLYERLLQVRDDYEVFCFQEVLTSQAGLQPHTPVRTNLLAELEQCLPDHQSLFCNTQEGFDPDGFMPYEVNFGQALFVHRSLQLRTHDIHFIFRHENALPRHANAPLGWGLGRAMQVVTLQQGRESYVIANVHGLWHASGKGDIPERLQQSHNSLNALAPIKTEKKIVVGDFNALPTSDSIQLIEDAGYRNLITAYEIADTRTVFYTKAPRWADFAFVSQAVNVKSFNVDQAPISDHAALLLSVA